MPCQDCTQPLFCHTGAASASETSMSSAEEARQAAARARQRLEEAAIIFGPCVRPEPKQPEPTEEESMAGRTSAHAKNGDRKASIKVIVLLIVHQLSNSVHLLLELLLQSGCYGP